jgi:hypothetical protein
MITEIKYPIWQTTINHLNEHMQCYGLYTGATKNVGLGDIQLLGGLTLNYEKTTTLDFLDFTIATGINFPTSKKQNINSPWCLPLGYNGHTAIPFISEVALGFFDWCTIGIQTGALWFNTIWRTMPFKTTYEQSGWIRLTRARACIEKGTIWHIDEYLKLDHIIGGFSAIFGFTHDHANRTVITPDNSQDFDSAIINSDECLHPWTLTAFNFMLEFDFATFNHPNIPRIAITIDKSISGKHAFDAALFGTHLAIDFEW